MRLIHSPLREESSDNREFRCRRACSMNEIQNALRILGLGINTTGPEIKQTYRDLAKVWHPDRFPNDPELRSKAQDKLKEINGAYHILRDYRPGSETRIPGEAEPRGANPVSTGSSEAMQQRRPPHFQSHPAPPPSPSKLKTGVLALRWTCIIGIVLAIGATTYLLNQKGNVRRSEPAARNTNGVGVSKEGPGSPVPSTREPVTQGKKPTVPANSRTYSPSAGSTLNSRHQGSDYFTVDSTKGEVLVVQGPPSSFDKHVFNYGNSKVYFNNGRVTRWDSSPSDPLKIRLLPSQPNMPNKGYFTVGSKKEEVLAVQGMPTGFDDRVFEYGMSKVYFSEGRVTRWDIQADFPLKVRGTAGQGLGDALDQSIPDSTFSRESP